MNCTHCTLTVLSRKPRRSPLLIQVPCDFVLSRAVYVLCSDLRSLCCLQQVFTAAGTGPLISPLHFSTNIIFNPQCPPVFMICSKSWSVFISCLQFALCLDFLSQFPLALSCSFCHTTNSSVDYCFPVFIHKSAERRVFKQLSRGSFSVTTNSFRFPSLKRRWRSYSLQPDDDFFYLFFRSKMQDSRLVMTPHVALICSDDRTWEARSRNTVESILKEMLLDSDSLCWYFFFLTSILYSKHTTTLEENLMTESDFFCFFPHAECSRVSSTTTRESSLCPAACFHSATVLERLAAEGAQLLWLKTKSPA